MQPSRHLIVVGVGVLVAFGNMPSGLSEPLPNQSQSAAKTDELLPFSLQETTDSVEPTPLSPPRAALSKTVLPKTVATEGITLTTIVPELSQLKVPMAVVQRPTAIAQLSEPTSRPNSPSATKLLRRLNEPKQSLTAQNTPNLAPAPSSSQGSAPSTTQPPLATPDPGPSRPLGPAKAGAAPDYLNPDPNPLSFPTKPEEVRLRGIQPITLQQAIELAQRNNRALQVTRLQLERDKAALRQAQAAGFPTLSTQVAFDRSRSASNSNQNNALSQLLGQSNVDQNTINNTFSASATLSYDIFTSGKRPANIKAAERQVRSDQLQVEINEEQLRLTVATDYYNLQEGDESVRIQQSSVRNNEASLRDTLALERAGLGTRFDVLQSQVQLANSQQAFTNAIAQRQIARRQLAELLSLSPAIDLAAADPVNIAGEWNLSLEESIVLALKNRAELEQQLVLREQAQQQRRAALAGLGPTVTAQAQYSIADTLDDSNPPGYGYDFQLGANWTLYDGGSSVAQAQQAEANIAIAEQNFADQSNQVRFAVEQGYANLLSNFENIGTTTQALGQAQEALRLARLRFQAGVGTSTDVINAENALTTAEGNRVNAIIGYNLALATLQRAVTHLPIPTGTTMPSLVSPTGSLSSKPSAPNTTTAPSGSSTPNTPASGTTPSGSKTP